MILLLVFITIVLIVISLNTVVNTFVLPRLQKSNDNLNTEPLVSVMIPARDEADVIGVTIQHLLTQTYPNYEVLLLDDHSSDGTAELARNAAQDSDRLMVISGEPLPADWMGKNWACHQMAQIAKGDILIFTDADVRWHPDALTAVVLSMQQTKADLFTVWPTQETVTWGERLCVPLMAFTILGYLPIIGTHYLPFSAFGAANGQCMAWRQAAYERIGGHQAIADNVLEDVTMAKMVKAAGLRLRMADGNRLLSCRMYVSWQEVRDGYAKNILAGYGSPAALMLGIVFHLIVFIFPWIMLVVAGFSPEWALWLLILIVLPVLIRIVISIYTHQRALDAFLMPVSVFLMTLIAIRALWWHYRYGGPLWKGRLIT